jgi:hypothetical protein
LQNDNGDVELRIQEIKNKIKAKEIKGKEALRKVKDKKKEGQRTNEK